MTVTFGFYNSVASDRLYNALQMSQIFDGIINDGVYMAIGGALMVEPNSPADLSVVVGTGRAWFDHTWTLNDADLQLTIDSPDVTFGRIDAIVLETNFNTNIRANSIKVVKGTPSATPVAPTMTHTTEVNQHPLAYVSVPVGISQILALHITNKVGTADCPFVTGVLQSFNISSLVAQWESEYDAWLVAREAEFDASLISQGNQFTNTWLPARLSEFNGWLSARETEFDDTWLPARLSEFNAWLSARTDEFDALMADLEDQFETIQAQIKDRNAILNGAMDIWQRGTTTDSIPHGYSRGATPDRFALNYGLTDGSAQSSQNVETPTLAFPFRYSLKVDTIQVVTVLDASQHVAIKYFMDGFDFKKLDGRVATLSFWVKAVKPGIYCVSLGNYLVPARRYVHEFTINSPSTWERKSLTLTFNSDGVFDHLSGIGLVIMWTIVAGANLRTNTSPDIWVTNESFATDNQVNGMDNISNNFYLTGVQLELGSVMTPFEEKNYKEEFAKCQRYYCRPVPNSTAIDLSEVRSGNLTSLFSIQFPVTMRTVPWLVLTDPLSYGLTDPSDTVLPVTELTAPLISRNFAKLLAVTTTEGLTAGDLTKLVTVADSYIGFDAEFYGT